MDWDFSIERNRALLLGVVAALFARIGLTEGGTVERLPRPLYRLVLVLLQAAEAGVRRLIIVAARNIVVEPRPKRPMPKGLLRSRNGKFQSRAQGQRNVESKGQGKSRPPSFNFCDPLKRSDSGGKHRRRYKGPEPRIWVIDYDPRIPRFLRGPDPTPAPVVANAPFKDNTVSAKNLCRRLIAIMHALRNLEREAKRYALWLAQSVEDRRPKRERALRYGWPSGWRVKPKHEVHEILKECQWLYHSLPEPNTS